jgi:hypothetical protein
LLRICMASPLGTSKYFGYMALTGNYRCGKMGLSDTQGPFDLDGAVSSGPASDF